jgi:hypothetical protein
MRLARAGARGALRARLGPWVLPGEVLLRAPGGRPPFVTEHLRGIFGREDLELAVRIGPPRPNRKPVVQVLTPDGDLLAFAKLGWNELTRILVRSEAAALEEVARGRPRTFVAPRVLHSGEWRELEVILLSPLPADVLRGDPLRQAPPVAATEEIAALSEPETAVLGASAYWQRVEERVAAAGTAALAEAADRVRGAYGRVRLTFASWHGDWSPWNMAHGRGRLAVWDWERSARGVPVGLDAAHFDLQLALAKRGHDVERALAAVVAGEAPLLSALSARDLARLLLALDLLELALRHAEGGGEGMDVTVGAYVRALRRCLP